MNTLWICVDSELDTIPAPHPSPFMPSGAPRWGEGEFMPGGHSTLTLHTFHFRIVEWL